MVLARDTHTTAGLGRWRRLVAPTSGDSGAARPVPPTMVAGVIPPAVLQEDEIVLLLAKPSLWFIPLTSFRFTLVAVLLGVLAVRMLEGIVSPQQLGLWVVLAVLGRLVWALLVWTSHIYLLTNRRIVTIRGVVNVAIFQTNLRKIQRTTLIKTLPERLLGLGTIGFATAATETFDSTWIMIPRPLQTHQQIVAAIQRMQ